MKPAILAAAFVGMMGAGALAQVPRSEAGGTPANLPAESRAVVQARGKDLIDAVNTSDESARREIVERITAASFLAQVGTDRVAAQLGRLNQSFAPMEFHHAELAEGSRGGQVWRVLHVYAKSAKSGRWHDVQVRVDPEAPNLLREIAFVAEVTEPVYLPNSGFESADATRWFDGYIDRLAEKEQLSGAVLIAIDDKVVFERYFGYADAARKSPVTAETRFNLGSGNKMFTALTVMMLERDGKLGLDDPIATYFPDFPGGAAAGKITISNLLSHTSGIGEYWTQETAGAVRAASSAHDLLPLVYKAGITGAPGESYEYSNSNFVLAGLIVEKVAGKPYDEFVRERITGPLGMTDTDTFPRDGSVARLAEPLTRDGDSWKPAPAGKRGGPAGGGYSTARDMLKFSGALAAGKVVPPETLATMTSPHTPAASRSQGDDYGYGFILAGTRAMPCYGHGGIASGVNFEFRRYPRLNATLITFSNQDNGAYDDLRRTAQKLLTGER